MNKSSDDHRTTLRARLLRWLRSVFFYALLLLLGGVVGNIWMTRNQASGTAPVIAGVSLNGQHTEIEYASFERPLLVYFFADWCPICKLQNSAIESIASDYPVVGVAMQSGDLNNVKAYVAAEQLALDVINDDTGRLSQGFSVNGVPAAFIIDKHGQILSSTRGYTNQWSLRARLLMARHGWL